MLGEAEAFFDEIAEEAGATVTFPSGASLRVVPGPTGEGEEHMLEDAQAHVDATGSFDVTGPKHIVCPVCHVALTMDDAADHDHLKPVGVEA